MIIKLRSVTALLLTLALAACSTDIALPTPNTQPETKAPDNTLDGTESFVEGQLIIGYQEGTSPTDIAAKLGATLNTDWPQINAALLNLPATLPVAKAEASAKRLRGLRYTQPNRVVWQEPEQSGVNTTGLSTQAVDINDPEYDKQWMHRQMNSEAAWNQGVSGKGVRIGIHDEFMDHRHPDLVDNMFYPGFDGFSGTLIEEDTPYDGVAEDNNNAIINHGTLVAGTAAGVGNSIGGRGTAYGASIVPLAISDPETGGLLLNAIVNAAIFAAIGPDGQLGGDDHAPGTDPETGPYVHIVNMSWGSNGYGQIIKDTMDFMLASGIVLVTSAGNTPTEGFTRPAWHPGLINVAATLPTDKRTVFSNRGLHLNVAAPGADIWTTTPRQCAISTPDFSSCDPESPEVSYQFVSGTSFSSPATAGTAALILEASAQRDSDGNITQVLGAAQVRQILEQSAQRPAGYDFNDLGYGIVDSAAAVKRAVEVRRGQRNVKAGGTLVVRSTLEGNENVNVPKVGLTLIPLDSDRVSIEYTQTSDGRLVIPTGTGLFQQIDPGNYLLQASGPHTATTGLEAITAETKVDVQPGQVTTVDFSLDVDTFDDPFEPNNTVEDAAELDEVGVTVRASLYDPEDDSDVDVYTLPVEAGTPYRVNLETVAGTFDTFLRVLAADGSVIAENDNNQDATLGTDSLVDFTAPATGTVYVEVTEISGAQGASNTNSPFNLYDMDVAPFIGDEVEPNGTANVNSSTISGVVFSNAQAIPFGSALNAAISESSDTDIFSFEVPAGATVVADVETATSGAPDTLLALYDAAGKQVAFNDDFTGRESRVDYTSEAGGTYYAVVVSWDAINPRNATTGPYGFIVTSFLNPPTE